MKKEKTGMIQQHQDFGASWVLWHKNTIDDSIADINKRFNLNVKIK